MMTSWTLQGAVVWNYVSEGGVNKISGQFTTGGEFSDTQGSGTINFTITSWNSWFLNDVNQSGNFTSGNPSAADQTSNDTFTWNRTSQTFTSFENDRLRGTESGAGTSSGVFIAAGVNDFKSALTGRVGGDQFTSANPTTTLTPVPEPEEWAFIVACGLLAFQWHRRRQRTAVSCPH